MMTQAKLVDTCGARLSTLFSPKHFGVVTLCFWQTVHRCMEWLFPTISMLSATVPQVAIKRFASISSGMTSL
jgi:hypothetical protein